MRQRLFARRCRRILTILGVTVVVVGALGVGGALWLYRGAKRSNIGELAFANRLAIPELAEPTIDQDGHKVFDLRFMAGETDLVDAGPSDTWGLNGTYLGPTLRAERGDRVQSTSPAASTRRPPSTGTGCTCPHGWTAAPTR